jgi:murein tripeptide amidase MpaA
MVQEGDKVANAGPAPNKPAILITGAHHARELITIQMVLFTLLKLL